MRVSGLCAAVERSVCMRSRNARSGGHAEISTSRDLAWCAPSLGRARASVANPPIRKEARSTPYTDSTPLVYERGPWLAASGEGEAGGIVGEGMRASRPRGVVWRGRRLVWRECMLWR